MKAVKDLLGTTTFIAMIMLVIVGTFYSAMDRPEGGAVVISLDTGR